MQTLACPTCGVPLTPAPHEVRVRCGHCGATVEVTSEGVTRAAAALQRAGIRVPDKPMTMEDIHARIAEREAAARAARNRAILVTSVCLGVAAVLVFTNETLLTAVTRMSEAGVTRLLAVNPADSRRLVGKVALHDLLKARSRNLEAERRWERILPWEYILPHALRPWVGGARSRAAGASQQGSDDPRAG